MKKEKRLVNELVSLLLELSVFLATLVVMAYVVAPLVFLLPIKGRIGEEFLIALYWLVTVFPAFLLLQSFQRTFDELEGNISTKYWKTVKKKLREEMRITKEKLFIIIFALIISILAEEVVMFDLEIPTAPFQSNEQGLVSFLSLIVIIAELNVVALGQAILGKFTNKNQT